MEILYNILGIIIGAVIAYLYLRGKSDSGASIRYETEKAQLTAAVQSLEAECIRLRNVTTQYISQIQTLTADAARLEAIVDSERDKYATLSRDREELKLAFENLANRIFDEKSDKLSETNQVQLDAILAPLKERLIDFHSVVLNTYRSEANERKSLEGQIIELVKRTDEIRLTADNLTNALKADTGKQGKWGELVLERVLEASGLRKGLEYKTQESFRNDNEDINRERIRPDAVVYLPDGKHIVIDAKVSLTAYEQLVNASSEEERKRCLAAHLLSVRNHIKGLAERRYQDITELSQPDFVLMFIPIESSFGAAVQADIDLFNTAWDKKIVLVSPSTLLATLKTIDNIWKRERQTENALKIAEKAGKLYDKLAGFVDDMEKIGEHITRTGKTFDDAMKKLSSGKGNAISQAEQLRDLGVMSSKQLPQKYLGFDDQ
jgi:DNA recombination protein RmuC